MSRAIITSNQNIPTMDTIVSHANDTHSLSLISMALIDESFKSLSINITYDSDLIAKQSLEHIIGIWTSYKPIKTRVRSYKKNDQYLPEIYGIRLEEPTLLNDIHVFGEYKFLIDIEETENKYTCKVYRVLENGNRLLTINVQN